MTMSTKTHPSLIPVSTEAAPSAIGPYSQAIRAGNLVFVSGCIPLVPSGERIVEGGIIQQTEQALANLKAVVKASGSDLGRVVKTTVFLKNMDDFVTVNGIYAKFFGDHKPARSAVEVARLPKDVLFEIECIASLPERFQQLSSEAQVRADAGLALKQLSDYVASIPPTAFLPPSPNTLGIPIKTQVSGSSGDAYIDQAADALVSLHLTPIETVTLADYMANLENKTQVLFFLKFDHESRQLWIHEKLAEMQARKDEERMSL